MRPIELKKKELNPNEIPPEFQGNDAIKIARLTFQPLFDILQSAECQCDISFNYLVEICKDEKLWIKR
jgi:hypothetical protein